MHFRQWNRRHFITLLGGAAAPSSMPKVNALDCVPTNELSANGLKALCGARPALRAA